MQATLWIINSVLWLLVMFFMYRDRLAANAKLYKLRYIDYGETTFYADYNLDIPTRTEFKVYCQVIEDDKPVRLVYKIFPRSHPFYSADVREFYSTLKGWHFI